MVGEGCVFCVGKSCPVFGALSIWISVIYALAKIVSPARFCFRCALTLTSSHARLRIHPLPLRYKKKRYHLVSLHLYGGRGWIRTTEVTDNRFTVCPLWPLGNSPIFIWSWWTDSNPRPADYKSAALPTELHQHFSPALFSCSVIIS